jgi:PBSX family phage portal protein
MGLNSDRKRSQRIVAKLFPIDPSVPPAPELDPGTSKQVAEDDPFTAMIREGLLIEPPFDQFALATMPENSTELEPCIDTMAQNIDGFGHRLVNRINLHLPEVGQDLIAKVKAEKIRLTNFFLYGGGPSDSFRTLRVKTRHDLEATGNAYWEVVRNGKGEIVYFSHMKSYQVRITPTESDPYRVNVPQYVIQPDGSLTIVAKPCMIRFRKFVQRNLAIRSGAVSGGYKKRWFKEFGDPRVYDNETGQEVPAGQIVTCSPAKQANEVIHWKLYSSRSPYGMPRYVGCLVDMFGDRKASEVNYVTFNNNNVPSLLVMVSNGSLTPDSIDRIKEMFERLQGDDNRSKVLVIEAEPLGMEGEEMGTAKIQAQPLSAAQQSDALFQKYSEANQVKVRVAFRIPPIFLGRSSDYSRNVADTARRLADEQVFAPARDEFDDFINRILFPHLQALYHQFKSNSPNTTDNAELVSILSGSERTGGMTPRIARQVLEQILGDELPPFKEGFDPDIPFSLTMAEAVKNLGDTTQPGQTVTALKAAGMILGGDSAAAQIVKGLQALRLQLEEDWNREVDGEHTEGADNDAGHAHN